MDLERFKKTKPTPAPKKREINGGQGVKAASATPKSHTTHETAGSLLGDDKDIFGIWQKQDSIKQQRKAEEAAAKAAKKAAKQAKKLEKQRSKAHRNRFANDYQGRTSKILKALPSYSTHKKVYAGVTAIVLLPVIAILLGVVFNSRQKPVTQPQVQGAETTVSANPDFVTIKPTTVDNQATSIKYDGTKKVASYNDVIDNVPITVSQQPLPTAFQADPTAKVAELAKQINANDKISTSDVTAYSGLSAKGPQTVVFTKNDLLIFIYADKKIDTLKWSKYIESMRSK